MNWRSPFRKKNNQNKHTEQTFGIHAFEKNPNERAKIA